jgi:alpha-L-fucosidase 2
MKRIALVLITSPSLSPENRHQFGTSIAAGPAMDPEILRDLFSNTRQRDVSLRKGKPTGSSSAATFLRRPGDAT